jgi:hypothetical protein
MRPALTQRPCLLLHGDHVGIADYDIVDSGFAREESDADGRRKMRHRKVACETRRRNAALAGQILTRRPSRTREMPRHRAVSGPFACVPVETGLAGWGGRIRNFAFRMIVSNPMACGRGLISRGQPAHERPHPRRLPQRRDAILRGTERVLFRNAKFRILPFQPASQGLHRPTRESTAKARRTGEHLDLT